MRSDVLTGRDARRWRWLSTCSVTATLQCPPGCCSLAPKSCPALCSPWTAARQAALSMGFSLQGYWSELSFSPPGHLPDPGIEPAPPVSSCIGHGFFTTEPPGKPSSIYSIETGVVLPQKPLTFWAGDSLLRVDVTPVHHRMFIISDLYPQVTSSKPQYDSQKCHQTLPYSPVGNENTAPQFRTTDKYCFIPSTS